MNRCLMPTLALAVTLACAPQAQAADQATAPSGHYTAVPGHTQVVFDIMHMGLSPFYGVFGKMTGSLQYDAAAPTKSTASIEIDTSGLYTPSDKLNDELKSAEVFNVATYPKATFISTAIRKTGVNKGELTGNLALNGVTKPVTLHVTFYGAKQSMGNRLGFSATGKIKRSDFGLTQMPWSQFVGDDVDLMIEAEFVQDTK